GGSAAETRVSGARAGRGTAVELLLPEEPTVSRVHAKFDFRDGQWRGTGLGRNGAMGDEKPGRGEQGGRAGGLIPVGKSAGGPGVASPDRPGIERGARMPAAPLPNGPPAPGPAAPPGAVWEESSCREPSL